MSVHGLNSPRFQKNTEKTLPDFPLRLQAKAGLTGFAQIYGRYNTTPSEKLKMDLLYIGRISMMLDLKLIFATLKIPLKNGEHLRCRGRKYHCHFLIKELNPWNPLHSPFAFYISLAAWTGVGLKPC